jgi:hypothetical protein
MNMAQKKDDNITTGDVAYMLSEASRILSAMGCAPSRNGDMITPPLRGVSSIQH